MGNIDKEKFLHIYNTSDSYKEVRNSEVMKNAHIVCLSGSHSYGTARDDSDIDIRAVTGLDKAIAFGALPDWETKEFSETDTVAYSYKKFLTLIPKGNPDVICLLGNDINDYLYLSDIGKELVTNYEGLIVAKKIYDSFVGYSNNMLRKLELAELGKLNENGENVDIITINNKKIDILKSTVHMAPSRYDTIKEDNLEACFKIVDDSVIVDKFNIDNISMNDLFDIVKDLKNVSLSFGKKGKRNKKHTDFKLNKHCMHLVRGMLMGNELLKTGKVVTYRKNDLDLLHSILNGEYMNDNGKMIPEFYELVGNLMKDADYALKNTVLPNELDQDKLNYFYCKFALACK